MPRPYTSADAGPTWAGIPQKLLNGLTGAGARDFCALECLANAPLFAKPDSQKVFLLWEAKNLAQCDDGFGNMIEGVKIETFENDPSHQWVYSLFMLGDIVRFPFNTWDSDMLLSLSWASVPPALQADQWEDRLRQLPRWSTASRSSLALIPQDAVQLSPVRVGDVDLKDRFELRDLPGNPWPNCPEWETSDNNRFWQIVKDPGEAAERVRGISLKSGAHPDANKRYKLYSIKTGVQYVGSKDESGAGKHRLEANCSMAMVRSRVIDRMRNDDDSFGVQIEVLTITAPLQRMDEDRNPRPPVIGEKPLRDGFQVRDLSCLKQGLHYMPGQAIPYARAAFDGNPTVAGQRDFWRRVFAVPLGRAKARLLLNYGLVHTSANAQNFLLGFDGDKLQQFVARDVGDTSWHDDYINQYLKGSAVGKVAHQAFDEEHQVFITHPKTHPTPGSYHLLRETSDTAYPPPFIMRLATNTLLTHDFARVLKERHGWTNPDVYLFTTGILDGFREFIEEAFNLGKLYPEHPNPLPGSEIRRFGIFGAYPTPKGRVDGVERWPGYEALVTELLQDTADNLFNKAAQVRKFGVGVQQNEEQMLASAFAFGDADYICTLINAEEILMCAGLEIRLGIRARTRDTGVNTQLVEHFRLGTWPKVVKLD